MNQPASFEQMIKILILGDSNVGKTNFLIRFTENSFSQNHITTIGYDYKSTILKIDDDRSVKLQLWDTAGQERFLSVTKNLLLRVQGIVLLYDITEYKSFESVTRWFSSLKETLGDKIPIVLVGNKVDIEANRQVELEEAQELATLFNVKLFEASAKENINVKETFLSLTLEIMNKFIHHKNENKISLEQQNIQTKNICC